jgi:parallel beta-helix repeat protein
MISLKKKSLYLRLIIIDTLDASEIALQEGGYYLFKKKFFLFTYLLNFNVMKNLYKFSILMMLIIIGQTAFADVKSITADGFCYLEGASDHSGTKVLFTAITPSAQTDSAFTNTDGLYAIGLQEGIYTVHFSHSGYLSYLIPEELQLFQNTTLYDVTLSPGTVVVVSGTQSGVWTAGNLYEVIGSISVPIGETLVIEPGVTVKFMDFYSFNVSGTLMAIGTEEDSIFFASGRADINIGDWEEIKFEDEAVDSSMLSYAKIEHAQFGIHCNYSSPTITNSKICNNDRGIYCEYSSFPLIDNCEICDNDSYGIHLYPGASPTITNNMIRNCSPGIYCNYSASPTISHNVIMNCSGGISCADYCHPIISYNLILNNDLNGIICFDSPQSYPHTLISHNVISGNSKGIRCSDSPVEIWNNTISNNGYGIEFTSSSFPSIIFNNIVYNNNTGIYITVQPTTLSNNLFDENNISAFGDGLPVTFGELLTVNVNGDPCDPYLNLFMDPLFVDPVNLDFNLTEDSPCIDAGNPDPEYYDPDGTIADIGALYYDQTILAPVINDFTGVPTEGISPLIVQFSADVSGPITAYSWNFGDGGSSSLMNPAHTYTKVGSFTITFTVTGPGGKTVMSKAEYITVFNPALIPNPDFSAQPISGYHPLTVEFLNLTPGEIDSLLWVFGDGSVSNQINPVHEYQNPGLYTVSLTAYNPHGYDTETKTDYIEVLEQMEVTAAFEVSGNYGCSPYFVEFTDQSTGTINSYLWDFGDGETSNEMNPVHTFTGADEYIVTLTVMGSLNTDIVSDTIVVELAEPFVTSIEDRPNDQGGFVYLNFNKSFYDTVIPQDGTKSTEGYSFQRFDNENWVSLTFVYATGDESYTVELNTLADSSATSNGLSAFRVIAGMDEGTWISEPAEGYSVDNLHPSTPEDFEGAFVDDLIELQWQPCPDEDFQYFAIYKTDGNGQFGDDPFITTISNGVTDIFDASDCSYKVIAIDFNGNQSPASEVLTAQNVQMSGGWSSLSAFVDPSFPAMEDVFSSIDSELIILQNLTGAYYPTENLNTLGEWDNSSGYFVKTNSGVNFPIVGKRVESNGLTLNAGWNLIPVLSECPVEISEVFAGTTVVMVKEITGTNMYWLETGVFTLETIDPGKAYFVLMIESGTISFPECAGE